MPNGLLAEDSLRVHPEGFALSLTRFCVTAKIFVSIWSTNSSGAIRTSSTRRPARWAS